MDISDMPDHIYINSEAFSSGQISSKLWLCEQLENIPFDKPQIIWIYGGWYGILSFLLLFFIMRYLSSSACNIVTGTAKVSVVAGKVAFLRVGKAFQIVSDGDVIGLFYVVLKT